MNFVEDPTQCKVLRKNMEGKRARNWTSYSTYRCLVSYGIFAGPEGSLSDDLTSYWRLALPSTIHVFTSSTKFTNFPRYYPLILLMDSTDINQLDQNI